jgi:glycosyltransferase involved in cell wall biosynthesis
LISGRKPGHEAGFCKASKTTELNSPMFSVRAQAPELIETSATLVSAGTKRMLVEFGKANWLDKARRRPDRKWGRGILQEAGSAKPMRILMAVPNYPFPVVGGLERQVHELAKALVQRGHVIHAVSSRFDPKQSDFEMIDGVHVHRVKWVEFKPARFLLSPFGLARILFRLKPEVDLVHVHNISWFGAFVTLFSKAVGLPVITKLPNIGDFGITGMRRGPFSFLRIALLKVSDAIVAMTPESVAELDGIGYSKARVLKVTNGISLLPSDSCKPRSSKTVNVIYVGRLSPEKGLSDLLHAWATVKARASRSVKLRMIGDGPQADELRALALALDLGETVEFFGYCEAVPTELAKSDLFIIPSYAEGNSNAILEAMRAGLPIVATRVGGAPIQVGREGERFLVPPGDRQVLSDRLLELMEDEALRHRLGTAMRERIESVFAIDRVAATYEQAYDLIVRGRHEQIGQLNLGLFSRNETEEITCAE